jgi:tRNA-specific 2-thiouridylase
MKVAVGMSGGVDSSVAALLLKEAGYDVAGITMSIWGKDKPEIEVKKNACYGPDEKHDIAEAEKICGQIGIPLYILDCSDQYEKTVLTYFRDEYVAARTPNPCIVCNHKIKFGVLPDSAKRTGIDFEKFATGHYANTVYDSSRNRYLLKKGKDSAKDQTYFLYRLSQEQLAGVLFPLGEMTKSEVRAKAKEYGLPVHEKRESQDFYSGDYKDLLDVSEKPGDIVRSDGKVIGIHKGLWNYTPGQRRGIGIAAEEPLYVLSLDPDSNRLVVGPKAEALYSSFIVKDINWIAVEKPVSRMDVTVKTRSSQNDVPAIIELTDSGSVKVTLEKAEPGISPGQSAVFYLDDTLLGGGTIDRVIDK